MKINYPRGFKTNMIFIRYLMIFAMMLAVVSCKQNAADTPKHIDLVAAHKEVENDTVHIAIESNIVYSRQRSISY